MAEKKYYWLRLKRDFFKRHDIQIIESMPNGKDYVLFYLKLLVESVDHNGELRFSETIPYNEQMLATITATNIDVVRAAMKVFTDLKMIEVFDDNTIYMTEVNKLLGTETYWAAQKRIQRIGQCPTNVQLMSNLSKQEIEKELDIDIDKEKDIQKEKRIEGKTKFSPPSLQEVQAYCAERKNKVDPQKFYDYFTEGNWKDSKGNKVKNWKQKIITWERNCLQSVSNCQESKPSKQPKYEIRVIDGQEVAVPID